MGFLIMTVLFTLFSFNLKNQSKIGYCLRQHPIFIYANLSNRGEALNNNTTTTAVNIIEGIIYVELYIVE